MDEEELNKLVELEIGEHTNGTSSSTPNGKKRKTAIGSDKPSKKPKIPKEQRKEQKRQRKEVVNTEDQAIVNGDFYEKDSRTAKKAEKKRLRALAKSGNEDDVESTAKTDEGKPLVNGDAKAAEFKAARKVERRLKAIQQAQSQVDESNHQVRDIAKSDTQTVTTENSAGLSVEKTAPQPNRTDRKPHLEALKKTKGHKILRRQDRVYPSELDTETSSVAAGPESSSRTPDSRYGAMKKAERKEYDTSERTPTKSNKKSAIPSISNNLNYQESPELSSLSHSDIDSFLSTNFITVSDPSTSTPLRPIISFSHLPPLTMTFASTLSAFKSPTPIQSAVWPFLFAGRDVIGVAETGSGKTLAFGVPCIDYIKSLPASSTRPQSKKYLGRAKAVIISPTRELALQSYEQMSILGKGANVQTVCLYGGVSKDPQKLALQSADIIIATPGRLIDLMNEGVADLSRVGYLVLDEADRMLDKGFEDDMRKIISATPSTLPVSSPTDDDVTDRPRQTLMFTATWPPSIRDLAASFLLNPVHISIGSNNPQGDLRANIRIMQTVEVVDPKSKESRLLQIIKKYQSGPSKNDRILVFCLYKKEAQRVESSLRAKGLRVVGIHGDLSQEKRTWSLMEFKKDGGTPLLVATDVAARGLDIPDVKLVVNLTFPLTVEDYVHRIGRTGRAGADGLAITLFTEHDKAQSGGLINVLKAAGQSVPDELLKFGTTVKKKGHEAYGAFYKDTGGEQKKASKITFDD